MEEAVRPNDSAGQHCSTGNKTLRFTHATWWLSLLRYTHNMTFHECSRCRQRESFPFKRSNVIHIFVKFCTWYCRYGFCTLHNVKYMLHLIFIQAFLQPLMLLWLFEFYCPILAAQPPSAAWEYHWCQQWVWVSPTKEGRCFRMMPEGPEEKKMGFFCNRKELLGSLSWERQRKKWKNTKVKRFIVTTYGIIHCPWCE